VRVGVCCVFSREGKRVQIELPEESVINTRSQLEVRIEV
jgi:hypothetical protein